jgi:hypothetical protein
MFQSLAEFSPDRAYDILRSHDQPLEENCGLIQEARGYYFLKACQLVLTLI